MEAIASTLITPVLRHSLTAAAGVLVTYGLLDPSMQGHFVTIATGAALGLIGMAWSLKKNAKK